MSKFSRFFLALFIFNAVIITHELGHFAAARLLNIDVEALSLGFGSSIATWQIAGGVEMRIGFIPLGGYISISEQGMLVLAEKSLWQTVFLYGAGIMINLLSPLIVLIIFSPSYRKFDAERRNFPETLLPVDLMAKRRLPRSFIGPIFFFRALMYPVGNNIAEEYAWKYTDFSRLVGILNLCPLPLFFDGGQVFRSLLEMYSFADAPVTRVVIFFLFIGAFDIWLKLMNRSPYYCRRLL